MKRTAHVTALMLTAIALTLTGCGRSPVDPMQTSPLQPGSQAGRGVQGEDPTPTVGGGENGTAALTVAADSAGVLHVGRWTLSIHKNSLPQRAVISLSVTDPASMEVFVTVTPASANNFKVPIELVADCSDLPGMSLNTDTIYWWNGDWQEATDVTFQDGAKQMKAKTTVLSNARLGARETTVKPKGK
jgi:hypothetical protein